jgi:hypothetical protein
MGDGGTGHVPTRAARMAHCGSNDEESTPPTTMLGLAAGYNAPLSRTAPPPTRTVHRVKLKEVGCGLCGSQIVQVHKLKLIGALKRDPKRQPADAAAPVELFRGGRRAVCSGVC